MPVSTRALGLPRPLRPRRLLCARLQFGRVLRLAGALTAAALLAVLLSSCSSGKRANGRSATSHTMPPGKAISFVTLSTATFPNPDIVPRDIVYLARTRRQADQWVNKGLLQLNGPAVLAKVKFSQFDVLGAFYIGDYPNLTINSIQRIPASKSQRASSLTVFITLKLVGPPKPPAPASFFFGAYGLAAVPKNEIGAKSVRLRVATQGPTCSPTFLPSCHPSG
jgi:hypothetical protein